MAISFDQIPILLRTPGSYTEYDASQARQGLAALPNRVLLIGSRTSAGTVDALELVQITRKEQGIEYFGRNSQLSRMVQKFKPQNKFVELWAIAMDDDAAGVARVQTITFTGTATETGVVNLLIGGQRVPVPIEDGDDATACASAANTAINANLDLPVTSASALGVVTATAVHEAAFTADIDIRHSYYAGEQLPAGITVAIAQTVAGATNPDVADVIAVLPEQQHFTTIVCGYNDDANMDALEDYLDTLWGPMVQRDGMLLTAFRGNYSATAAYGAARNSQFSSVMAANLSPNPAYEWAAVYGAVETTQTDPAIPRQTLSLPGLLPANTDVLYTLDEQNLLLFGGMATHNVDPAGNISIQRAITTYQFNAQNIEDDTFLDITTMRTLAAIRYTLNAMISSKYPRHKLADDGTRTGPGQKVATPSMVRGDILQLFTQWELSGWVEGFEQFKEELIVERNLTDRNRLDALLPTDFINQFVVMASKVQFIL